MKQLFLLLALTALFTSCGKPEESKSNNSQTSTGQPITTASSFLAQQMAGNRFCGNTYEYLDSQDTFVRFIITYNHDGTYIAQAQDFMENTILESANGTWSASSDSVAIVNRNGEGATYPAEVRGGELILYLSDAKDIVDAETYDLCNDDINNYWGRY